MKKKRGVMNPDPDEVINPEAENIKWLTKEALQGNEPYPHYSIFTEQARNFISLEKQCALFCGGRRCKYERADCWPNQMVINGLFSHWVTDNILAMARPNTAAIKEFNILQQFEDVGIKTLINLQQSGEHASCGPGLEESGFTYNPQDFMDKDIYFYNFGFPDFGASSNSAILDMVHVMQFALSQGKVAIHCHAGLGRTGFLICAYLVFSNRMSANDAIHYVREKRPRSIQTRIQMQSLKEFACYLQQLWIICTFTENVSCEYTLQQYLTRQRKLLHGYEARKLKYIPKIIYFTCERLLELAERGSALSSPKKTPEVFAPWRKSGTPLAPSLSTDVSSEARTKGLSDSSSGRESKNEEWRQRAEGAGPSKTNPCDKSVFSIEELYKWWRQMTEMEATCLKPEAIVIALCDSTFEEAVIKRRNELKHELNTSDSGWKSLAKESDPLVLAALLWDWLNRLKEPILRFADFKGLVSNINDPILGLCTLEKSPHMVLEYFSKVIVRLLPLPDKHLTHLIDLLLSHLTHHYILTDVCKPHWRCKHWLDLPTSTELVTYFKSLIRADYQKLSEKYLLLKQNSE